jgi:hypothetical protein
VTSKEVGGAALALYVAIDRDVEYFLDEALNASPEVLTLLFQMFTHPNSNTPESHAETNRIGADLLRGILEKRNLLIPGEPSAIEQVVEGVLQDGS